MVKKLFYPLILGIALCGACATAPYRQMPQPVSMRSLSGAEVEMPVRIHLIIAWTLGTIGIVAPIAAFVATGELGMLALIFVSLPATLLILPAFINLVPAYCVKPGCAAVLAHGGCVPLDSRKCYGTDAIPATPLTKAISHLQSVSSRI
jgi:hypothetical protein